MNNKHRKVLRALFAHPISANIDPRKVQAVLKELGAEFDNRHGGRLGVRLGGHFAEFHFGQHALSKDQVVQVKKYLETCGIDPQADPQL